MLWTGKEGQQTVGFCGDVYRSYMSDWAITLTRFKKLRKVEQESQQVGHKQVQASSS